EAVADHPARPGKLVYPTARPHHLIGRQDIHIIGQRRDATDRSHICVAIEEYLFNVVLHVKVFRLLYSLSQIRVPSSSGAAKVQQVHIEKLPPVEGYMMCLYVEDEIIYLTLWSGRCLHHFRRFHSKKVAKDLVQ